MSPAEKAFSKKVRPLAEKLINHAMTSGKSQGISDVRVAIYSAEEQENKIEKGEVIDITTGSNQQITVTLFSGDKVLTFTKNSFDEGTLCEAIDQNIQAIHVVPENTDKRLLESSKVYKGQKEALDLYDKKQPNYQELINYAKEIEASAAAQPNIKGSRSVDISSQVTHKFVLATNGFDYVSSGTLYRASAGVVAEDKSGMQIGYDYSMARHFSDMAHPKEIGKKAAENAIAKLGAVLPNTADMPIVLSPEAAASFFSAVYSAISGSNVYKGTTFLKGKVGQQVMSKGITLIDNPRVKKGVSSSCIDASGFEAKKITFIKDGVLKSYNYGLLESRQLGLEPIGRDGGLTNSSVLPGKQTPEELMADIKDGIYIKGFTGGSVDVNDGIHSRQAQGLMIKDGKITDVAVDGFVVSGNLKEMFMNVSLANDTANLPNNKTAFVVPTTRINGVLIAGK